MVHEVQPVGHDGKIEDAREVRRVPHARARMLSGDIRKVPRRRVWQICAVTMVTVSALALYSRAALSAQSGTATNLKLGVPAYVFPGDPPLVTLQTMRPAPRIVILNPGNGDAPFSASWQSQADRLRARGTTVLGYVHTDGGTRPIADVEASINNYLQSPPGHPHVSGIFLDEMATSCSLKPFYVSVRKYIRGLDSAAFVVANPGTPVNVCYLQPAGVVARTFVTFEHDAATYISGYQGNVVAADSTISAGSQYPVTDFWHLVYGTSSGDMPRVVALAAARHAGYAYVTDGDLPNPWDSLATYINAEANAMAGR